MRKYILTIMLAVLTMSMAAQGIQFETSTWQEALDKAKSENKLLFVDVWATWCGPCKKLAKEVFPQQAVGDFFNANFVCFKMQTDIEDKATRDLYQQLAGKYNIGALPTLLWVTGDGKMEHFFIGYAEADKLIEEAKKAMNPELRTSKVADNWATQPHTLENGLIYFETNKDNTDAFDEFFMGLPVEDKCSEQLNMLLYRKVTMPANSQTLQYMASKGDSLSAIYPVAKDWNAQLVSQVRRLLSVVPMGKEDSITAYFERYNIPEIQMAGDDYHCLKLFRYGKIDEAFDLARQMMKKYADTKLSFVSDLVDVTFFCATKQQTLFSKKQKKELLAWAKEHVERNNVKNDYHNNFLLIEAYGLCGDKKNAAVYADKIKANLKSEQQLQFYDEMLRSIDSIR